jgi:hypothetical protein
LLPNLGLFFGLEEKMDTWKLAYIRMNQAEKVALESQHIQQALAARKQARFEYRRKSLSKIQAIKDFVLRYGEIFYCRTLGFIHSRPD